MHFLNENLCAAFFCLCFSFVIFLAPKFRTKNALVNVDEIDGRISAARKLRQNEVYGKVLV